jgi:hypothetical protein
MTVIYMILLPMVQQLLYDYGLSSDLEAYYNMKRSLEVEISELPEEAQDLIKDLDSKIESISKEMRSKILRLYSILSGDDSLNQN